MAYTKIHPEHWQVSAWSGGVTNQIAIAPAGALYGNRDFLWRVSSALVELEESDFTPLPDYDRHLAVLEGELLLSHGEGKTVTLCPGQTYGFDGGVSTHSWGRCRDFNLMLRKGACTGTMEWNTLGTRDTLRLVPAAGESLLVYCHRGSLLCRLPEETLSLEPGQSLLLETGSLELEAGDGAELLLCRMQSLG